MVALDRYRDAPAMQVAHRSYEVSMLDGKRLREIIEAEKPDYIIPEIEAIATDTLLELEAEGYHVVPTAKAAKLTMNREGIRRLAAEELGLPTSPYRFASTRAEFTEAVREVGIPCVVKPVMSSSGHGQSVIRTEEDVERAWYVSQHEGRTGSGRVIVEGFIPFDYEITQLTVRHAGGTSFLEPIGHYQEDGDYRESWQPQPMTPALKEQAQFIAGKVTDALGGWGIFGVELFIRGDQVIFKGIRTVSNLPTSKMCSPNPIRRCAFSVSRRSKDIAAWPYCLPGAKIFPKHAKRPVVPMPNCKSMCTTGSSCPARVGSANIE